MGLGMEILFVLMLGLLVLGSEADARFVGTRGAGQSGIRECDAWPKISTRRRTRCCVRGRQDRLLSRLSWGL